MQLENLSKFLSYELLSVGKTTILVSNITAFIAIFLAFIVVKKISSRFFNKLRHNAEEINVPTIYMIERFVHYVLLAVTLVISLSALGLDMTHLALVATALSVGIGFGLQSIFNNFSQALLCYLSAA